MARKSPTIIELAIVVAILGIFGSIVSNGCRRSGGESTAAPEESAADREARELTARLQSRLTPPAGTVWKDGLAAVVLVDVSGSMHDRIKGERRRKIEAAQAAAIDLVGAFTALRHCAPRHAGAGRRARVQRPFWLAGGPGGHPPGQAESAHGERRHPGDEDRRGHADW